MAGAGVGPGIERFHVPGEGSVNSFLLIGPRSVVVVDTQRTAVEARALAARVTSLGLPLEAIVLTHEHPDHIVGLSVLMDAFPGVPVHASDMTRDYIRSQGPALMVQMRSMFGDAIPSRLPVPGLSLPSEGRVMLAGREWQVRTLGPGESSGTTLLYDARSGDLLASDLVANRMVPWLVDEHTCDWLRQVGDSLVAYPASTRLHPGHGDSGPAPELLRWQRRYLQRFHAAVSEVTTDGPALDDADRRAVDGIMQREFPALPRVAPPPNLVGMNADAVAKELAARPDCARSAAAHAEIHAFNARWNALAAGLGRGELDAFMAQYAPDVGWMPPDEAPAGIDAIRTQFEYFVRHPEASIQHAVDEVAVADSGEVATVRGTYSFSPGAAGAQTQQGKFLLVLSRQSVGWRIHTDMFSSNSPAAPAGAKP